MIRDGDEVIFVEVKKASDFDRAAERFTARQLGRLQRAATEYLGREPGGSLTSARIDVALVNSTGQCRILENVTL